MRKSVRRAPALAVLAASILPFASATASTPPLLWQGAKVLAVQCIVQRGPFRNDAALGSALCARVARFAARGAAMPVRIIPLGDPTVIAPGTVALLVHGSVEALPGAGRRGRMLAFSMRPFRASVDQSAILFAAAPRAVAVNGAGLASPALDAALVSALSETLPWQARPQGPQRLPTRN